MPQYVWWRVAVASLALLAVCLPVATRLLIGQRGAIVHVRWQPSTEQTERQQLEARFRLADGQRLDDFTWRYDLIDPSTDNIRALVSDPAVGDTHHIDRPHSSLEPSATRTARRHRFAFGGDATVRVVDTLAMLLAAFAGFLCVLGVSRRAATPRAVQDLLVRTLSRVSGLAARAAAPVARLLSRGIPELDAHTAGLFRIVFGTLVVAFFSSHRVDASWLNAAFTLAIRDDVHASLVRWLSANPDVLGLLTPWLLTMGVAFTVGIFTRFTYALFVAGAIMWAYVAVLRDSTHPHSTLILALLALLPARWGDAWSIDGRLRRHRGQQSALRAAGKQYGYSVWVPGLVCGIAFAAAAWAKLTHGTGWADWILNGSIKYHFITDSINAPVEWGLQFARYPLLAIVASFGAVATEALVLTAAFSRREWYRLALGIAALGLLAGFWLFMGVLWAGWWILLLAFLPWQRLSRVSASLQRQAAGRDFGMRATAAQVTAVALLIAQQVVISARGIERAPMFTHYPMYSSTHASAAEFDASLLPSYRIVVSTDRGTFELPCNAYEDLVEEFGAALQGSAEAAASVWRRVRACGDDLADAHHVTLEGDSRVFDWDRQKLIWTRAAVVLGPLAADRGTASASSR